MNVLYKNFLGTYILKLKSQLLTWSMRTQYYYCYLNKWKCSHWLYQFVFHVRWTSEEGIYITLFSERSLISLYDNEYLILVLSLILEVPIVMGMVNWSWLHIQWHCIGIVHMCGTISGSVVFWLQSVSRGQSLDFIQLLNPITSLCLQNARTLVSIGFRHFLPLSVPCWIWDLHKM